MSKQNRYNRYKGRIWFIYELYKHEIFSEDIIESIKDNYTWNKENYKSKEKDDFEIGI